MEEHDSKECLEIRRGIGWFKGRLLLRIACVLVLFFLGVSILLAEVWILERAVYGISGIICEEKDDFRRQVVTPEAWAELRRQYRVLEMEERKWDIYELLALTMIREDYLLAKAASARWSGDDLERASYYVETYSPDAFYALAEAYRAIWKDVSCFPVPKSKYEDKAKVSFEDSWMFERKYGGVRGHEGTDIMGAANRRGYYPILSMTDGVVEKMGWLEKGGYRIGIRSTHGAYFYYAHLDSYAEDLTVGQEVEAGMLLGFMGDSGYGTVPGTVGKFDVHLHLGIYIASPNYKELSVNPYWPLRYSVQWKRTVDY